MSRFYTLYLFLIFFVTVASAQEMKNNVLLDIMHEQPMLDSILKNKEQYRLQIIYTQINRDEKNQPRLTTWCLDTGRYFFYTASMVKLLECPLALEKIDNIARDYPISIYDSLMISGDPCGDPNQSIYLILPNLSMPAEMIKEMFLVSNNRAFNPLYDFLTQRYFNKRAHELGLNSTVICNRFAACDTFQNRINPTIIFRDRGTGEIKYLQPASVNPEQPIVTHLNTIVGKGFMSNDTLGPPKNFSYNNYVSLFDLHKLLTYLIFPSVQPKKHRLELNKGDYEFLQKYMGMYPRESIYPKYDSIEFPDIKMKFFITPTDTFGHAPKNIRVFNKVGQAYGFTTDCSYFADTENKVEFFLSCTMYTNKADILNTGAYEYDAIAIPFFRKLCAAIYDYELMRPRKHPPVFDDWDFTDVVH
jgi:hypothetical protein